MNNDELFENTKKLLKKINDLTESNWNKKEVGAEFGKLLDTYLTRHGEILPQEEKTQYEQIKSNTEEIPKKQIKKVLKNLQKIIMQKFYQNEFLQLINAGKKLAHSAEWQTAYKNYGNLQATLKEVSNKLKKQIAYKKELILANFRINNTGNYPKNEVRTITILEKLDRAVREDNCEDEFFQRIEAEKKITGNKKLPVRKDYKQFLKETQRSKTLPPLIKQIDQQKTELFRNFQDLYNIFKESDYFKCYESFFQKITYEDVSTQSFKQFFENCENKFSKTLLAQKINFRCKTYIPGLIFSFKKTNPQTTSHSLFRARKPKKLFIKNDNSSADPKKDSEPRS